VVQANRAVAVAMAEGPAAGLALLDPLLEDPRLSRWAQLHMARADLLGRLGRNAEAIDSYQRVLMLEPPRAERALATKRIGQLTPP
jgi:RNA polymerase sigma-70 factor (ECF subfamily)